MRPARLGYVPLALAGRTVDLRFSWEALDTLGSSIAAAEIAKVATGAPGDSTSLARLIAVASAGEVSEAEAQSELVDVVAARAAVLEAWVMATIGPNREEREPASPRMSRPTWWRRAFQPRSRAA